MKMETKPNQQDSLRIINEMIAEARNTFTEGNAKTMINMGYIVATISILNIVLLYTLSTPSYSFFIWLLMLPITLIDSYLSKKRRQKTGATTHLEKIISAVWGAYGISMIVLLTIIFSFVYITDKWEYVALITPVILTFLGMAQCVTAIVCKYKPYKIAAYVFWLGALICIFIVLTPYAVLQFVVLAICMILGFVVPSRLISKVSARNV